MGYRPLDRRTGFLIRGGRSSGMGREQIGMTVVEVCGER